eukprot:CAMPEP_0174258626 /NCGR_PEP_ID=MMETSP0439-20130205/7588_1 /TAXON_ID=0 /ORGANISM="Stereomyxa ramosa, Strain Chinc5" /LENGTH=1025 /DNA_ID=CAMNT_0015342201 /DNA_START=69 /DNA_END=3149 /DNA_ORIENTATION=-
MNQMLNKVLVSVLGKYLAYYMTNFSKDSFNLEVMKGTFELEDIDINCQFLKDTVVLPNLEITDCSCNKIHLYIPWANLSTEPIVFDLDTISMTMVEIGAGEEPQFAVKKKRVKPTSYGFIQRTLDGIKMNVKAVNITIKLNGYRGNPYICKIFCKGIKIYSCGPDWQPVDLKDSFVADKENAEVLLYKVMECEDLEVAFSDISPKRLNPDEPPKYASIMKRVPVQIRCKVLKDINDGSVICGTFDLFMSRMEMSFSDRQWKGFAELIKSIVGCFTRTDQEYKFYRDVGREYDDEDEERDKEQPERASSWWGSLTNWDKKKKSRQERKMEEEKIRKMEEWADRQRLKDELSALGKDVAHLEIEDTTFNIIIEKGTLNMLDEEHGYSEDPDFDAFGRLHFDGMKCVLRLPPATEVPQDNKWTDSDPNRRLLAEASLELANLALVLQESVDDSFDRTKQGKDSTQERKQVVLITDGRSERIKQVTKEVVTRRSSIPEPKQKEKTSLKKKLFKKRGNSKTPPKAKAEALRKRADSLGTFRPFSRVTWEVVSNAPNEKDMAKWLQNIECDMKINVYKNNLLLLHHWWARLVQFMETSSLGSDDVEAMTLMKVVCSIKVTDNKMIIPLVGCDDLVVPTMEEILAAPHICLESTYLTAGKSALDPRTAALFKKMRLDFSKADPSQQKKRIVGMGGDKHGWLAHTLLRKTQRYQFLLENMCLKMGDTKIQSPVDFQFELALSRFTTTQQLLLECCCFSEVLQINLSRSEYFLWLHFKQTVLQRIWDEVILVLIRKYHTSGDLQQALGDMSLHDAANHCGSIMPLVENNTNLIKYMMIYVDGKKTDYDSLFEGDEENKGKDIQNGGEESPLFELHLNDVKIKSNNSEILEMKEYNKEAKIDHVSLFLPPSAANYVESGYQIKIPSEAPATNGTTAWNRIRPSGMVEETSDDEIKRVEVKKITGNILADEFEAVHSVLLSRNHKCLTQKLRFKEIIEPSVEMEDNSGLLIDGKQENLTTEIMDSVCELIQNNVDY